MIKIAIIGYGVLTVSYKNIYEWRYTNNSNKRKKYLIFLDYNHKFAIYRNWFVGGCIE